MIDINLLPPEYAPKKLVSIANLAMISLLFLIGLSLIMSSLKLFAAVENYSERLEYHDQQIKSYRVQAEEIRQLGTKVKLLNTRLSLVKELLQENVTWSDKLFELCQCLPRNGAWLEGVTIERDRAGQRTRRVDVRTPGAEAPSVVPLTAKITGGAVSVDKVRQFVASLEDSETFNNVVLDSVSSRSARSDVDSFISFEVTVEIVTLDEGL
jgi:Tfp pilus assembly protein PilN